MTERIIAVAVICNPDADFPKRLASYAAQAEAVIVADNSTDGMSRELPGAKIIRNRENLGLAAAQNLGIRQALRQNPEWVLLMDDDSIAEPGMVSAMLNAYRSYSERDKIGLIAPRVIDRNTGAEQRIIAGGALSIRRVGFEGPWRDDALTAIASGSLVKAEALKKCGLMREEYFIDGVDIEFSLRLRRQGFRLLMARDAGLNHRLGNKKRHGAFTASNHAAWRRYTMYRNRIDIWKHYASAFPAYAGYDAMVAAYEVMKILAFEEEKTAKLGAILRGIKDGVLGRFPNPFE